LSLRLYVDAISSVGGHAFDVKRIGITACSITPNKCIESTPGISFVIIDKLEKKRLRSESRSFYFDLRTQCERCESSLTPYTAAIPTVFACREALRRWATEGVACRIARYRSQRSKLRKILRALGLQLVPIPVALQSNILLLVRRPPELDYAALAAFMRARQIEIYSPEVMLNNGMMFFASMGQLDDRSIRRVQRALSDALPVCVHKTIASSDLPAAQR
jgi:aspartate aminotransferase-like enzyme